ncbi:MAG: peptide-methionine (S)-S-oxide reductase MsrA [Hyphomicrobiaceae bacterium]|nr:peptide-methionine (S)-S-oxide reductase MsrA [Hyphomicrobiaceae bacterium]
MSTTSRRVVLALLAGLAISVLLAVRPADVEAGEAKAPGANVGIATFGSGCFWCTEADFDKVPGVLSTVSGYMGGTTKNPTYREVSTGRTGHVEVLQVTFDPAIVSYGQLLHHYWRTTDVLDGGGQFCDRGNHYRPVIFAHTPEQRALAEAGKKRLDESGRFERPVAVEILDASSFTPAEDYHQNYYKTNADGYRVYRYGCRRDQRLRELWGDAAATPTN